MNEDIGVQVFSFDSYKAYLSEAKNLHRGLLTKIAEAAGCELSYLSKCLTQETHITPDQGYRIVRFLNLDPMESDYFLGLVDLERSGDSSHQSFIKSKLREIKKAKEDLRSQTQLPTLHGESGQMLYHSNWAFSAVHMATSIRKLRDPSMLSEKLSLSSTAVERILQALEALEYIKKVGSRSYEYQSGSLHVPKDSPYVVLHHQNWRTKATEDSQNPSSTGVHYTNVQTMSREDYEKLKTLLLKQIKRIEEIAGPSTPEELVNINIDIFKF